MARTRLAGWAGGRPAGLRALARTRLAGRVLKPDRFLSFFLSIFQSHPPTTTPPSYEGDLLAAAGASMTWGRESAAKYGEVNGGRRNIFNLNNFGSKHVNPFWDPTAEKPIALPHVNTAYPGEVRWRGGAGTLGWMVRADTMMMM